jgi:hypothetical protein
MRKHTRVLIALMLLGAAGYFVSQLLSLGDFSLPTRTPFAVGYGFALVSVCLVILLLWESRRTSPPKDGDPTGS